MNMADKVADKQRTQEQIRDDDEARTSMESANTSTASAVLPVPEHEPSEELIIQDASNISLQDDITLARQRDEASLHSDEVVHEPDDRSNASCTNSSADKTTSPIEDTIDEAIAEKQSNEGSAERSPREARPYPEPDSSEPQHVEQICADSSELPTDLAIFTDSLHDPTEATRGDNEERDADADGESGSQVNVPADYVQTLKQRVEPEETATFASCGSSLHLQDQLSHDTSEDSVVLPSPDDERVVIEAPGDEEAPVAELVVEDIDTPQDVNTENGYEHLSPVHVANEVPTCRIEHDEAEDSDDTSSTISSTELDAMMADDTATIKPSQVLNDTGPIEAPSSPMSSTPTNSSPPQQLHLPEANDQKQSPFQSRSPHATSPSDAPPLTPSQTTTIPLNDDETLLHDFLARTRASKAARIASQEHASHRRDSGAIKDALSSRTALEDITANVTSLTEPAIQCGPLDDGPEPNLTSPTLMLDFHPPSIPGPATGKKSTSGSPDRSRRRARRSSTAAPYAPAEEKGEEDELTAPTRISLRHGPHVPLVPRKSDAQALALCTRTNTRRNKGSSVPVKLMLMRIKTGETPVDEDAKGAATTNGKGKKRNVRWNEELVSFFNESARDVKFESLDADEDKPRNRRKRALGGVNGTPAKARTKAVGLEDSAPVIEGEVNGESRKRTRGAIEENLEEASEAKGVEKPQVKARRMPSKAVNINAKAEQSITQSDAAAVTKESEVDKWEGQEAEKKPPQRQITKRSGLPQRSSVRTRR